MTIPNELAQLRKKRSERTVQGFVGTFLLSLLFARWLSAIMLASMGALLIYLVWSVPVWDMEDIYHLHH